VKGITTIAICFAAFQSVSCLATDVEQHGRLYEGSGCVSAAVAVSEDAFIASSAKDNVLRIYPTEGTSEPIASLDVSKFLELEREPADIQGAARVADRVYWITSHSRDENGGFRPGRYRFFATTIRETDTGFDIEPVGKPCTTLLNGLPSRNTVSTLRLDKAMRLDEELPEKQRKRLAPTKEGLRIEALCSDPHTHVLFIGFRNPRPVRVTTGRSHALVVPLNNPADVVEKAKEPIFGEAMLWDFDGSGIAGLEYSPFHKMYLVLARPHDGNSPTTLYCWSGMKANSPTSICTLSPRSAGANAKTLMAFEDSDKLLLLAGVGDDANTRPPKKHFQSIQIRP
jgi:hypothetical protein